MNKITLCFLIFLTSSLNLRASKKIEIKYVRNNIILSNSLTIEKKEEKFSLQSKKNIKILFYTDEQGHSFNSKSDILIKFKDVTLMEIKEIEKNYSIKLRKKMIIGDYLFKNTGNLDTVDIINQLLENKKGKILRIFPDKRLNLEKR